LAQKLGWAIGAAAAGWLLSVTHFVANADVQSDSAMMGIRLLVSVIPGVLYASCAIVMAFYNLDNATMTQMKNELEARRVNSK
jgi:GPH family glycoside/pentoside/hexuronide:cation symporter